MNLVQHLARVAGLLNTYSKSKVKLVTEVERDQKAPYSIATTLKCRGALLLSLDYSTLPLICTL